MDKNIWMIVLIVALVGAFVYIGYDEYSEKKQARESLIFEQGVSYGSTQTITQIAQMAVTCNPVPLNIENQTINMIAVDCLSVEES